VSYHSESIFQSHVRAAGSMNMRVQIVSQADRKVTRTRLIAEPSVGPCGDENWVLQESAHVP
jgi:hypothetical protein